MCGRYVNTKKIDDIKKRFNIDRQENNELSISPSYNISPTQYSPVIVQDSTKRIIKNMHWGLIPAWSKDKKFSSNLINARLETIKEKPSFKNLVDTNRCIVVANGYYEWTQTDNGKQPFFIHNNNNFLPMAALWTQWQDITSFTIITKSSDSSIKTIHHRMPLILDDNCIELYLDHNISFDQSYKISESLLKYHKVASIVNSPANNDASCIDSLDIS
jgi:putative SOS response-associated peptidase YedK